MLVLLSMLESDKERELFWELYNRYGNGMIRVAQRYFPKSQQDVEDAVQNAWLKAVKNFSKILEVPCNKRGAYLVIIVKNEAISMLRKRRQELPFEEAWFQEETKEDDTASVLDILQQMPEIYRAVLQLRFVEECTSREIAKMLHLTVGTVNTRIHRGRTLLIAKLREEGYTP